MKKLLLITIILFAFNAKGQHGFLDSDIFFANGKTYKYDTTKNIGYMYSDEGDSVQIAKDTVIIDTVPKIALVTNLDDNLAGQVSIYEVRRYIKYGSGLRSYNMEYFGYGFRQEPLHVCYLTEDKKPIPSHWVIWQVK